MIEYYITSISNLSCEMTEEIISNSSKFRIDKYNAINSKEVKKEILAATYLIDKHLRKYGLREKDMEYMIGKNGKPSFENHPEINFSISHSKDLVLVAFSDIEIGCDIQIVKNIDSNIFDKVLSGDEKNNVCTTINDGLADNNNELQLEKFFYYWVQKETILKRDGSGLKDDISKIYDTYGVVKKLMYNKQKNSIDEMLDVHNIEDLSKIKLQDFEKYDIYLMCINNGKSNEFIELHESY